MPPSTDTTQLIAEADKCVLCGMCLPHCPTYSVARNENESPRGRLMLGKALLEGKLEVDTQLLGHIEQCLVCRSCERSCPSGVKFGFFMDGLRDVLSGGKPRDNTQPGELLDTLEDPGKRRHLNTQLWLAQRSGIASAGKLFAGAQTKRLLQSLPHVTRFKPLAERYAATGAEAARVMLFTGCSSELLGNTLVTTAIDLLTRLGITVDVPAGQQCCGGLSRHHGQADRAARLEQQNLATFNADASIPVLSLASGCGASLLDYEDDAFRSRVMDINTFLFRLLKDSDRSFTPLEETVVLHTPCSLQNVMKQDKAVAALLGLVPGLEVLPLAGQRGCCGAAGTYMYEQPVMADALRASIIERLAEQGPARLVTTNIGCAMHIAAGLREAGVKIDVVHPVELLSEALGVSNRRSD